MGSIINFRCKDCDESIEYYFGIGMMYSPENVFYGDNQIIYDLVKEEKIKKIIRSKLEKKSIHGDEYGNEFYYCKNCRTIEMKFYFSINENNDIYIPKYYCELCKNEIEKINVFENIEFVYYPNEMTPNFEIRCKKCNSKNTVFIEWGNWD